MTHGNVLDGADAVLVTDMQNSFLRPEGALYRYRGAVLRETDRTIARIADVAAAAAGRGISVIYTRHCYRPGYPEAGDATLRLFKSMGIEPLVRDTWDAAIVDELSPGPEAVVVDKTRFDAFHGTDLDALIRGTGGTRLVVTGIITNVCVETTARAAAVRDLDVTVLGDCCTTYTAGHQASALDALEFYGFARVATWSGEGRAGPPTPAPAGSAEPAQR